MCKKLIFNFYILSFLYLNYYNGSVRSYMRSIIINLKFKHELKYLLLFT